MGIAERAEQSFEIVLVALVGSMERFLKREGECTDLGSGLALGSLFLLHPKM